MSKLDNNHPIWKVKFLIGLLKILGDKVRHKIKEYGGEIPYKKHTYSELNSFIQKKGIKSGKH